MGKAKLGRGKKNIFMKTLHGRSCGSQATSWPSQRACHPAVSSSSSADPDLICPPGLNLFFFILQRENKGKPFLPPHPPTSPLYFLRDPGLGPQQKQNQFMEAGFRKEK